MESQSRDEVKGPVLHIVVVGFHHKKGCQVRGPLSCAGAANSYIDQYKFTDKTPTI